MEVDLILSCLERSILRSAFRNWMERLSDTSGQMVSLSHGLYNASTEYVV
jgi:DNA-binding IclR family transcriptional regulator